MMVKFGDRSFDANHPNENFIFTVDLTGECQESFSDCIEAVDHIAVLRCSFRNSCFKNLSFSLLRGRLWSKFYRCAYKLWVYRILYDIVFVSAVLLVIGVRKQMEDGIHQAPSDYCCGRSGNGRFWGNLLTPMKLIKKIFEMILHIPERHMDWIRLRKRFS